MTALTFEPLHDEFGARATGVDLAAPLPDDTVAEIHAAIDTYSFLCFPGQSFDDDRQLAFTRRLGEPEENHVSLGRDGVVDYFGTIGNVRADGTKLGNAHRRVVFQTGNNMWHTDSSFRAAPSCVSIMCAYEVPDEGGETRFASARAAWARLPQPRQDEIDPLVAVHDYVFSRGKVSPDAVSPSHAASLPPVRQRLVRTNPRTGAKNYYVGSHVRAVEGWSEERGRALLDDLLARAVGEEHVHTHAWEPGQLVIWDNRCLLHQGAGYDADRYRRYMRQTRVRGVPTLEE